MGKDRATGNDDELGRALIPGIGFGAALSLIQFELPLWGLGVFILAVGLLVVTQPAIFRGTGMEQRTIFDADLTKSQLTAPLVIPGVAALGSFALEPAPIEPVIAAPLVFLVMSAATTWSFLRITRQQQAVGRRRAKAALAKAPFREATADRVAAVSTPAGRQVVRGLHEIGAVDGIQVRMWRLAKVADADVESLHATCRELEKLGIVRVSGIDSGSDKPRNLVELTPVGVRVTTESRSR